MRDAEMTMDMSKAVLQVLLTKVESGYEAHCLPMDIVTEAATVEQAIADICDLICAQYRYGRDTHNLDSIFVPAPPEDWKKLAHARVIGSHDLDVCGASEHCDDAPIQNGLMVQEYELVGAR